MVFIEVAICVMKTRIGYPGNIRITLPILRMLRMPLIIIMTSKNSVVATSGPKSVFLTFKTNIKMV